MRCSEVSSDESRKTEVIEQRDLITLHTLDASTTLREGAYSRLVGRTLDFYTYNHKLCLQ